MFILFALTLFLVGLYLGHWATTRRETIRRYRDRLVEAADAEETITRYDSSTP